MQAHSQLDQPSAWIVRFARRIPEGEVLDLACGGGRHARLLAALGHAVTALDRDGTALSKLCDESIRTLQFDLEDGALQWPFEADRFAGIVVTNYLHRPLFPCILRSLAPDGVLLYETFAHGNERFGKPSNPAFLLAPGELLESMWLDPASRMRVLAYEDGYVDLPKPAMVQRICALKNLADVQPDTFRLT